MSLSQLKWALRRQIKERLAQVSDSSAQEQGRAVAKLLFEMPELKAAKTVGLYMNLPSGELPTDRLLENAFASGQRVFLPRVTPLAESDTKRFANQKAILHFLEVKSLSEAQGLPPRGKYQIREPEFDGRTDLLPDGETLDVLVVPGLAFSKDGRRLGHGAGFYDDFIKRYAEKHSGADRPFLVAVGLEEQLLDRDQGDILHTEGHDEHLDAVVLGDSLYRAN